MHGRFNSDSSQIPVSQSSLQVAAQGVRGFELICDVHKSTNCSPHFELHLLRGCDFVQMNHSDGEIFIDTEVNCLVFRVLNHDPRGDVGQVFMFTGHDHSLGNVNSV